MNLFSRHINKRKTQVRVDLLPGRKGVLFLAEIYGYIRVSSRDQNEDRQMVAMREQSIPENYLHG